nr:hypothetical protein [Elizabethkingia sp. ASV34]
MQKQTYSPPEIIVEFIEMEYCISNSSSEDNNVEVKPENPDAEWPGGVEDDNIIG